METHLLSRQIGKAEESLYTHLRWFEPEGLSEQLSWVYTDANLSKEVYQAAGIRKICLKETGARI
jgi:hypothetical protein